MIDRNTPNKPRPKASEKRRVGKSQRLSKLMPKLLGPVMQARGMTISRIITEWPRLSGSAQYWSEPQSLKFPPGKTMDGSLMVNVASGRGPEMQMMTHEIITRINQLFGYKAIARIAITQTAMRQKIKAVPPKIVREWGPEEKTAFNTARGKITSNASPELQKALDNLGKSLAED